MSHNGMYGTMTPMSTGYEETGRTSQKQRTRDALVEAARRLISEGEVPTVERTAEVAGISRTTAYRYFSGKNDLLAAAHPLTHTDTLLPADAPPDPEDRVAIVVDRFLEALVDEIAQQRTTLRLSLDPSVSSDAIPLRRGRAIAWLTEALEPAADQLGRAEVDRLVRAIRSAIGIEALVWLTDVVGLSVDDAVDQMRWSAATLYRGAVAKG